PEASADVERVDGMEGLAAGIGQLLDGAREDGEEADPAGEMRRLTRLHEAGGLHPPGLAPARLGPGAGRGHAGPPARTSLSRRGAIRVEHVAFVQDRVGDLPGTLEAHAACSPASARSASMTSSKVATARRAFRLSSASSVSRLRRSHPAFG